MRENMFRAVALTAMLSVGLTNFAQGYRDVKAASKENHALVKVTFMANDGSGASVDTMLSTNANLDDIFPVQTPHRYFVRWSPTPDGSVNSKRNRREIALSSDTTLYAIWEYTTEKEAVDLGLPSGIMWADSNLGASLPEEKGFKYKWSRPLPTHVEAVIKSEEAYYSKTYCYRMMIPNRIVDPEDDAAMLNLGIGWRTPTSDEMEELLECCKWRKTTRNGVKGYTVTSKTNGNAIFLPLVEYESRYNDYSRSYCNYWTSELYSSDPYDIAKSLDISAFRKNVTDEDIYFDFPIRPVRDRTVREVKEPLDTAFKIACEVTLYSNYNKHVENWYTINYPEETQSAVRKVIYVLNDVDPEFKRIIEIPDKDGKPFAISDPEKYFAYLRNDVGYGYLETFNFFRSWNTSPDGTGETYMPGDIVVLKDSLKLYAQWEDFWQNGPVDLGLPSGNKWYPFNVGASEPEETGYYSFCSWLNPVSPFYYLNHEIANNLLFDHCDFTFYDLNVDYVTNGDGLKCVRCPDRDDYEELFKYCKWERAERNGVKGYNVTSTFNFKTLFFPATGYLDDEASLEDSDELYYWTADDVKGNYDFSYCMNVRGGRKRFKVQRSDYPMPTRLIYNDTPVQKVEVVIPREELPVCTLTYVFDVYANDTTVALYRKSDKVELIWPCASCLPNFVEWNTQQDGRGLSYDLLQPLSIYSNMTLYAIWRDDMASCTQNKSRSKSLECVDLGLPSGLKWATRNIGAASDEDHGYPFAWGETRPKEYYHWPSYKHGSDPDSLNRCDISAMTMGSDSTYHLSPENDVATQYIGENWHTPSKADFDELLTHCDCEIVTRKRTLGLLATSKVNGNSVFLPLSGMKSYGSFYAVGWAGYYWTSTLASDSRSQALYYDLSTDGKFQCTKLQRCIGLSVRPVCY